MLCVCLIGFGLFCMALLVMTVVWSYWCYKYPVFVEDDVDWENEDYEFD